MLTEEVLENYGIVKKTVIQVTCEEADRYYWLLYRGQYQAYGMTPSQLAASTEILVNQSDTSTVEAPIMASQRLQTQVPSANGRDTCESLQGEGRVPLSNHRTL